MSRALTLFNVPIGVPFFPSFVETLLAGEIVPALSRASDPLAFADTTIFVPTRRAGEALKDALVAAFDQRPLILPRIVPLGDPADLDDRSILSGDVLVGDISAGSGTLPPAVGPLHRRLVLMRLIEGWRQAVRKSLMGHDEARGPMLREEEFFEVASSPADAFGLAGDLAALMDEMTIEDADWGALGSPAPEHDRYWDITAEFLHIAGEAWPAMLAAEGKIDDAERRKRLLNNETERLLRERPPAPMIVAGSTGSQPATAALMAAIAALPNGAVVLPGLDRQLDEAAWEAITVLGGNSARSLVSPQAILKRLIALRLGVSRADIRDIGVSPAASTLAETLAGTLAGTLAAARGRLVSQMLRPASTTEHWVEARLAEPAALATAFEGLTIVEAGDEREEALAIAIAMREVLLAPDRTAMLVTPDRGLGLRVSSELKRFGIAIDDSAGCSLSQTPRGSLAALVLEAAMAAGEPMALLALLRHGQVRLGLPRDEVERLTATFDIGLLRNGALGPGFAGLREALADLLAKPSPDRRRPRAFQRLRPSLAELTPALIDPLEAVLLPLMEALCDKAVPLPRLAALHRAAIAQLTMDEDGVSDGFAETDGDALGALFDEIAETGGTGFGADGGAAAVYLPLFEALLESETLRPRAGGHPRLKIYGPLEARLLEADIVIIGGLNEGSWPPIARTDAFLSRPMRERVGLGPPERRIGQNAHDFSMLMGAPSVMLTRALRGDGTPTIASRYLRRLKAYAGDALWQEASARGAFYGDAARRLDDVSEGTIAVHAPRPKPCPPLDLRPASLSITEIETLYRDPYAIFARHVLQLDPLGDRLAPPDQRDYGNAVHDAVARFVGDYAAIPPGKRLVHLLALGHQQFEHLGEHLAIRTFWWPRFQREAAWFVRFEEQRRESILASVVESGGRIELTLADGSPFLLRGRADRIDLMPSGGFAVIDYKTGVPPGGKEVLSGRNPQLTLTAMMVRAGGFSAVRGKTQLDEALYVRLSAAGDGGKVIRIDPRTETLDALVDRHGAQMLKTLSGYRRIETGYLSRKMPKTLAYAGAYDHLARVPEWNDPGDGAEDEA